MNPSEKRAVFERFLLVLLGFFLLLVAYEHGVLIPRTQARAYEHASRETTERIGEAKPLAARKALTFASLQADVNRFLERSIPVGRTDLVLEFVREVAVRCRVKVPQIDFTPEGSSPGAALVPVELSMSIEGTYSQVATFIEELEVGWFETYHHAVSLSSLTLVSAASGRGVRASLKITILMGRKRA